MKGIVGDNCSVTVYPFLNWKIVYSIRVPLGGQPRGDRKLERQVRKTSNCGSKQQ